VWPALRWGGGGKVDGLPKVDEWVSRSPSGEGGVLWKVSQKRRFDWKLPFLDKPEF